MVFLSELQYSMQRVCTPVAFSVNSLLIQLILYKSPKNLGMYKYLMIYISLFEITYSILDALATPDFYSSETLFVVLTRSDKVILPRWALKPLTSVLCSMFGLSMGVFVLHFIYRYLVISGNPFLSTMTFRKLAIWFLSPVLYGIVWGCFVWVTLGENKYSDEILKHNYLSSRGLMIENITYFGPNYWISQPDGTEKLNKRALFGMSVIMVMVSASIFSIVFFATKSYKRMSVLVGSSSNSSHYRSLQLQLLNSLVAQALIPACLMQGPSCVIFTAPFLHLGTEVLGCILGITVSLYPALDPFPTMLIVKHYRNALFKPFQKAPKRSAPGINAQTVDKQVQATRL